MSEVKEMLREKFNFKGTKQPKPTKEDSKVRSSLREKFKGTDTSNIDLSKVDIVELTNDIEELRKELEEKADFLDEFNAEYDRLTKEKLERELENATDEGYKRQAKREYQQAKIKKRFNKHYEEVPRAEETLKELKEGYKVLQTLEGIKEGYKEEYKELIHREREKEKAKELREAGLI